MTKCTSFNIKNTKEIIWHNLSRYDLIYADGFRTLYDSGVDKAGLKDKSGCITEELVDMLITQVISHWNNFYNKKYAEYLNNRYLLSGLKQIPDLIKTLETVHKVMKKVHIEEVKCWEREHKKDIDFCDNSLNLLKTLNEYDGSISVKYKIYGLALQWANNYASLLSTENIYNDLFPKLFRDVGIEEDVFINTKKKLFDDYLSTRKQIMTPQITNFLGNVVIKIININCELLPNDLQTADAALTISKYFENKRVDSLKEAINLYFEEKKINEQSEQEKLEQEETREILQEQILNLKSLIEENIKTQEQHNAILFSSIDNAFKSFNNKQDAIVGKYNELVDKHNDLVEKHNKLVDDLKSN